MLTWSYLAAFNGIPAASACNIEPCFPPAAPGRQELTPEFSPLRWVWWAVPRSLLDGRTDGWTERPPPRCQGLAGPGNAGLEAESSRWEPGAAPVATSPPAPGQGGLGDAEHGEMSPVGMAAAGHCSDRRLRKVLGAAAGPSRDFAEGKKKKSPRVSSELLLLSMAPQKQAPARLRVPAEMIAFPEHFFLD